MKFTKTLSAAFLAAMTIGLASCEVKMDLPADQREEVIVKDADVFANALGDLYDDVVTSGDANSERILNNVLFLYAKSYFGDFYESLRRGRQPQRRRCPRRLQKGRRHRRQSEGQGLLQHDQDLDPQNLLDRGQQHHLPKGQGLRRKALRQGPTRRPLRLPGSRSVHQEGSSKANTPSRTRSSSSTPTTSPRSAIITRTTSSVRFSRTPTARRSSANT